MKKFFLIILFMFFSYNSSFANPIAEKTLSITFSNKTFKQAIESIIQEYNNQYSVDNFSFIRWSIEYSDSLPTNRISIDVSHKTLQDIFQILFDKITIKFKIYYDFQNSFVNILPMTIENDSSYILNLTLPSFNINNKTRNATLINLCKNISNTEKFKNFSGFGYPIDAMIRSKDDTANFSLSIKNKNIRFILNSIVTSLPQNYCGYSYEIKYRTIEFFYK